MTNPAPDPASDATGQDTGQKQAQTHSPTRAGLPCGHWGHWKVDYPHLFPELQPDPVRVVPFQRRNPCPGHELGTQARWDSGWEKGLPHCKTLELPSLS